MMRSRTGWWPVPARDLGYGHAHGTQLWRFLVGFQVRHAPRLRDLVDQTLYGIDKSIRYQHIGPLVRGAIQPRLFLTHWDDLLRTAELQSSRRKNVLTRALQEYGRLNKTIFILRYLRTPA
ncbi:MAG: Tn3 family transposase [Verrucomicrobia bacterium]|nr:Tn3 family transposase [Verrucomicrobiota bacterium]